MPCASTWDRGSPTGTSPLYEATPYQQLLLPTSLAACAPFAPGECKIVPEAPATWPRWRFPGGERGILATRKQLRTRAGRARRY